MQGIPASFGRQSDPVKTKAAFFRTLIKQPPNVVQEYPGTKSSTTL
ncbi:MAG: hypothetical protein IJT41_03755 [Clostridia bacterium]|nr:hypothetical protein [Clostridia bacterium]